MSTLIELDNVSKSYLEGTTRHLVLDSVSQEFAASELVALQGRSGSGKSTLLNLIAAIDLPDAGDILVEGVAINRVDDRQRTLYRRRIGFVFQFFNLIPTLTVEENLLMPLELLEGSIDSSSRERAQQYLERVGLETRGDSFPDRLSGGEQQRVAIARALIHRPRLLLADEPTGNLDQDTGAAVLELLEALCRADGITLIAATHSRSVAEIADRVFHIEHGRLLEGSP
jgi:putative ABC transport system ATP-binding protein